MYAVFDNRSGDFSLWTPKNILGTLEQKLHGKTLNSTYFLHFSQLYMLSPLSSSAEKKAAKQSCSVIVGPRNQLKQKPGEILIVLYSKQIIS